jgi:hypothetical protein
VPFSIHLEIIDNVFLTLFFKQVLFCLLKVPIDEKNSVHEDAVKKLMKIWMGFKEIQLREERDRNKLGEGSGAPRSSDLKDAKSSILAIS